MPDASLLLVVFGVFVVFVVVVAVAVAVAVAADVVVVYLRFISDPPIGR